MDWDSAAWIMIPTWRLHKRIVLPGGLTEDSVLVLEGNMLSYGGASAMWELLTGDNAVAPYSHANAYIAAGDSSEGPDPGQTNLMGTNARVGMDEDYPKHTASNNSGTISITFRSFFPNGVAEFRWEEIALFNAAAGGRMFNRRVASMGERVPGSNWTVDLTFSIQSVPGSA